MNPENQNQPSVNNPPQPATQTRPGGGMTLHPSEGFAQEMQEQQPQQPIAQPVQEPQPVRPQQPQQPQTAWQEQPIQLMAQPTQPPAFPSPVERPQPTQPPVAFMGGAIGSTPGGQYERPKADRSFFQSKRFIFGGIAAFLALIGGVLALLIFTGVISLTGFKTVNYTGETGTEYSLSYYFEHTLRDNADAPPSLLSGVSKNNKLPVMFQMDSTDTESSLVLGDDCSAFEKAFDVRNNNLDKTISVCQIGVQDGSEPGVYIAMFEYEGKSHIMTFSQDYSQVDYTTAEARDESMSSFGLTSYDDDIKKIIASIKVK